MCSLRRLIVSALVGGWCLAAFPAAATAAEVVVMAQGEIEFEEDYTPNGEVAWDPIEPVNRGIFWFNDKLYFYAMKPIARGYRAVVPEVGREAVGNVFTNLGAPVRIVNNALQGKVIGTLDELTIFVANSIFGIGGIFDLHKDSRKPLPEDFGQTLGSYGIPNGPYLVLPFFGPSNLRDGIGMVADNLVEPLQSPYYLKMHQAEVIAAVTGEKINILSLDKDSYEAVVRESLDPYVTVRDAYLQNRTARVAN